MPVERDPTSHASTAIRNRYWPRYYLCTCKGDCRVNRSPTLSAVSLIALETNRALIVSNVGVSNGMMEKRVDEYITVLFEEASAQAVN